MMPREAARRIVFALVLIGATAVLLGAAVLAWRMGDDVAGARVHMLVGALAAGAMAAACLAGAMRYLDESLAQGAGEKAWLRWALISNKRLLMVVQVVAMGVAAGAGVALVLGM